MITVARRVRRLVFAGGAALAIAVTPTVFMSQVVEPPSAETLGQPCYSGVLPGNPYVPNCTLPQNRPRVRGAAPDANAIIACRGIPGCLAWYVNGP